LRQVQNVPGAIAILNGGALLLDNEIISSDIVSTVSAFHGRLVARGLRRFSPGCFVTFPRGAA
jgi:hypothetical protein